MPQKGKTGRAFRVGRVKAYQRGKVWYLCYHEHGKRKRPRVGRDKVVARKVAAEVNAQLEMGAPSMLSFERVPIPELRERWLTYHDKVKRSSLQTIRRYRAATEHLLRFIGGNGVGSDASRLTLAKAEEFVGYLRSVRVAPNGHPKAKKRLLRDKGVLYIVEACRALFGFALKHRHLSPYAPNPFSEIGVNRLPVEDAKPIRLFTPDEEKRFLEACDDWQFPVLATLMMTGLRPGELCHLLLPGDFDLDGGVLHVTNKADLGWQVKTRSEREIPLHPALVDVLRRAVGNRKVGPAFLSRAPGRRMGATCVEKAVEEQTRRAEVEAGRVLDRAERARACRKAWVEAGALTSKTIRREFMRLTLRIGLPEMTEPKVLRHIFATMLQEANVDPLIRMELMGHAPQGGRSGGPLGMTTVYTHSSPATRRSQLLAALEDRACTAVARRRTEGEGTAALAG